MCKENLIIKANNNSEAAEWAENKNYFDVSISRYYYCLYEKAIYIAINKGFYSNGLNGQDSHQQFIVDFQRNLVNKLSPADIAWLATFGDLRRLRNSADYHLTCTSEKQFKLDFKYKFQQINSILNRLAG